MPYQSNKLLKGMKQQVQISRSEVLALAHKIRKEEGLSFSQSQIAAWKAVRLMEALKSGVVSFSYKKEDGSLRSAKGSTNPGLFSYEHKGDAKPAKAVVVKYYDFDANGWRSCRADRIDRIAA